ncbi:MAG: SDR family oxidoreductase [Geminicoccaceae bacterium]|nr:SDR family oxidoreductase [Geminicoccaceae bacterium]MCB9943586.1 SDR family oxidoreductase [Geminicoccaceae bacterium]
MTETGRTAILTAAGSGMGAACARLLAGRGYRVAILSSSGKGEKLAGELGGIGITGSNRNADDLQRLVETTMDRFGRIDALVNSAGHGPKGDLLSLSDDDWYQGFDVYLMPMIRMARLVTPIMERQQHGSIVNITTFATFEPDPVFPTSGVARAGLAAFTKLYADRYAKSGIRINNVMPGFISSLPEKAERTATIPMGRYGTPEEIAETVAFLVGDGAGYITGQNIRVDGSLTRSV